MWEYKVEYIAIISDEDPDTSLFSKTGDIKDTGVYLWQILLAEELNKLGNDGWEVVSIPGRLLEGGADGYVLFKRLVRSKER